jgi:hypothetical protein
MTGRVGLLSVARHSARITRRQRLAFEVVFAATLAASISGCAAVISRSSYPVFIDSEPREASFVIRDDDGSDVYAGTTPETVALDSSAGAFDAAEYTVTFQKPGHHECVARIEGELDSWYFGNILFPGLLGFLIDPLLGGMWELDRRLFVSLPPVTD